MKVDKALTEREKVYHLHFMQKLWMICVLILVACAVVFVWYGQLSKNSQSDLFLALFITLSGIGIAICCAMAWTIRIEISSEGIAFYGVWFHIYTPWQNIAGEAKIRHPYFVGFLFPTPVLLLREPASTHYSIQEGKQRGIAVIEKYPGHIPRQALSSLPLSKSILSPKDRKDGIFAHYIRIYGPQSPQEPYR